MKLLYLTSLALIASTLITSCNSTEDTKQLTTEHTEEVKTSWKIPLDELSDEEYINNPDIAIRHSLSTTLEYSNLELVKNIDNTFTFKFIPHNSVDTIILESIQLMEWIPTICEIAKNDIYLSEIAIINQEWNRHQVKFKEGKFKITGVNKHIIKRVDLARNCLNAYLWEIITYAEEDGKLKPYYHGWFNFPKDLYGELFEERNNIAYSTYKVPLENWEDPENKTIEFEKLRLITSEKSVTFTNLNHEEYPLIGERKKKHINIVYPKNTTVIDKFLTDSTLFATFSPPGFYNPAEPRITKLSLLKYPKKIYYKELKNDLFEIEVNYYNIDSSIITKLYVSGLSKSDIPTLSVENVNDGWKNSMGFGNHTFYESYEHCLAHCSKTSEFFALLTDENNKWLDSHFIGIDGPLLHWDEKEEGLLHLWILAFERHAFVGHYTFKIN